MLDYNLLLRTSNATQLTFTQIVVLFFNNLPAPTLIASLNWSAHVEVPNKKPGRILFSGLSTVRYNTCFSFLYSKKRNVYLIK